MEAAGMRGGSPLGLPADEVRIEGLRTGEVGAQQVVPDESAHFVPPKGWARRSTTRERVELLRRVASLVPPPRTNLTRFHGVVEPGACREHAVECPRETRQAARPGRTSPAGQRAVSRPG
ncbi:hypothetical protein F0U59_38845 [Archangium gephyra]|nr:hypothetical protein F0U59_38845 [Archangium gephyra]